MILFSKKTPYYNNYKKIMDIFICNYKTNKIITKNPNCKYVSIDKNNVLSKKKHSTKLIKIKQHTTNDTFKQSRNKHYKFFRAGLCSKSGRSRFGVITVRSRGLNSNKSIFYNFKVSGILTSVCFFSIKNYYKFLKLSGVLIQVADGSKLVSPTQTITIPGILYLPPHLVHNQIEHQFKLLSNVFLGSLIKNLNSGFFTYGSAPGSFCTLLFSYGLSRFVMLPSGLICLLEGTLPCLVFIKTIPLKNYLNRGVKLMRAYSKRPVVRGVVKNPCDHPHGGRTKSVSYPQTP